MIDFSSLAVDPVFDVFGVSGLYTDASGIGSLPVTVIPRRPDDTMGALGASIHTGTALFEVRSSELEAPEKGGKITLGSDVYVIQSAPRYLDDLRHIWLLDTYPEGE